MFDEGYNFGALVRDALFPCLHFGQPVFWRLDGGMGSVVSKVEKEGLVFVLRRAVGDIIDRPVTEEIGSMTFGTDRFFVQAHIVVAVA